VLVLGGREVAIEELEVVRTDFGVTVRPRAGGASVDLVEHLFAALGGLSIRAGVRIVVSGPEIPLLDGGALELGRAIMMLGLPRDRPTLRVRAATEIAVGDALYRFEPGDGTELEVTVDFDRAGLGTQHASFDGSSEAFFDSIASARTFGFLADAELLRARGRARCVDPSSVLVIDDEGRALPPGLPMQPGELARHKLLDLIGDLYRFGGPPRGRVIARRPGHSATQSALERAIDEGALARTG
jgi:UDP-3-O-[3-hydroxymyristoyl] N-acetylglucosamine deacetylase